MSVNYNPRVVTDGLVLCLDAGNTKSVPKTNILSSWTEYNGGSVHYEILGDYSIKLKNTSTAWIGYYPATISVTGRYVLTFTYYADSNGSSLVVDNDGIMNNTYNTTLTANITPQTHTGIVDVTTTGNILHFLRRGSGGNIFITNVSYFKLESSWTDLSGNGNNGTFGAGSAAPTYSSANGGSLSFDGSNDYVNGNLGGPLNAPFTLEVFGKFNNVTQYNYEYFGSIGDLSTNGMISISKIGTVDTNTAYRGFMYVYPGFGDAKKTNIDLRTTNYQHLVIVLLSSSPYIKVYKNGVEGSMVDALSAPINTNGNYRIGTWSNNTWWLNGNIASFKIYNRVLTAAEVSQNFNSLRGRFGI